MPIFVGGVMGKRGEDYRFYIKSKIKSLMKFLMKYLMKYLMTKKV